MYGPKKKKKLISSVKLVRTYCSDSLKVILIYFLEKLELESY